MAYGRSVKDSSVENLMDFIALLSMVVGIGEEFGQVESNQLWSDSAEEQCWVDGEVLVSNASVKVIEFSEISLELENPLD